MDHEGMTCGVVDWTEQVQEEYDVQNVACIIGKLKFPKTLNHLLSNWKTSSFSKMTFNFMVTAECRVLLEMFRYLPVQNFTDLRKLKLVIKFH